MMQHRRFTFAVIWMLAALLAAPAQAQAQQAGTLIAANPIPNAPAGMRAWKITYRTTSQEGRSLQATGVVAAPDVMPVPPQRGGHLQRQVIAWTHGAWGVAEKCGPSLAPNFLTISPTQHGFLVNRTNAGVITRLAQNNCITLDMKPKIGTALGVMSVRGALRNKDIGTIQPWAGIARATAPIPVRSAVR